MCRSILLALSFTLAIQDIVLRDTRHAIGALLPAPLRAFLRSRRPLILIAQVPSDTTSIAPLNGVRQSALLARFKSRVFLPIPPPLGGLSRFDALGFACPDYSGYVRLLASQYRALNSACLTSKLAAREPRLGQPVAGPVDCTYFPVRLFRAGFPRTTLLRASNGSPVSAQYPRGYIAARVGAYLDSAPRGPPPSIARV